MCTYVYPSGYMYLSASCVRVSMIAFVCVHARVREGVCVSPSLRPSVVCLSVRVHVRASKCFRAYLLARPSVRPFVCLSVCPHAYSCVQMFDRTCMRSSLHAFVCLHARLREAYV